jgi:hypothetical protein
MVQYSMEEDVINKILAEMPQLTTKEIRAHYNELALAPINSHSQFLAALADNPSIYDKVIIAKEKRQRKLQMALQDAEDALIENAANGDVKSVEFLLKTMNSEYREKKQLDIQISHKYQEQLQQLDIAITSNQFGGFLEADIDEK